MPLEANFTGSSTGGKIRGLNHSQTTMGNSKTIDHQPIQLRRCPTAAPGGENHTPPDELRRRRRSAQQDAKD
jgi:quinol monooxygenase YgiN